MVFWTLSVPRHDTFSVVFHDSLVTFDQLYSVLLLSQLSQINLSGHLEKNRLMNTEVNHKYMNEIILCVKK